MTKDYFFDTSMNRQRTSNLDIILDAHRFHIHTHSWGIAACRRSSYSRTWFVERNRPEFGSQVVFCLVE